MPIITLKDCQKGWEKYRIRLNNEYNKTIRNNHTVMDLDNQLIEDYISSYTKSILSIRESINFKRDFLLLGNCTDNIFRVNGVHELGNIEPSLIELLGCICGVTLQSIDGKLTSELILKALKKKEKYNIMGSKLLIVLKTIEGNGINMESYLLNDKICQLYMDNLLYISDSDKADQIRSVKDIEIYQEGGLITTKVLDIALFYVPGKITQE